RIFAEGVRSDSVYVPRQHEDDVQSLALANPDALIITDLSVVATGSEGLSVATIDGVAPQGATIATGSYPYAQEIRLYLKREHLVVVPGLRQFLSEALGAAALGEHGYLRPLGLVPRQPSSPTADVILSRAR